MFWNLYKYRILRLVRKKDTLFWSLFFPIILGTLFYLAFGNFSEEESFQAIPAAVVVESTTEKATAFLTVLDELSKEDEDQLILLTRCDLVEAKSLLKDQKINGYILVKEDITLSINKSGINENILKSFLDKYQRMQSAITTIASTHPELLSSTIEQLNADITYTNEISLGNAKPDPMLAYFYALLAMTCIYGSLWGIDNVMDFQANMSPLAARRSLTPTHKMKLILADSFAAFTIHASEIMIVILYLKLGLGIYFGNRLGYVVLACFVGSIIGISFGTFFSTLIKGTYKIKHATVMGLSMLLCFLSGLMVLNMKDWIEHSYPIVNRLNPCALLVDALYSLNIYQSLERYYFNLSIMLVMAGVLCFGSYLLLRRTKYASI